ncbi:MAG: 6-carboxytetrahydropterin synthase [Acidobacteriales bacterium]|nr:6-carboxytetrahydropterin synthase [Terriglobales bacterium]
MTRLTRRYRFSASHRLHTASLTEEGNRELYGKCNYPYGHGHNYELEVSVRGNVDPSSGMLVRVEDLDKLVAGRVIRDMDHRDLNGDVVEFARLVPTTENLAEVVRSRLKAAWAGTFGASGVELDGIRIRETGKNIVELRS